jgi:multidrug efflux pump subunit AcrB
MALLMLVLGTLSFAYMNIHIFPAINRPVVMMVWNYPGLSPFDMERRMVTISERALSTTVNAIEHLESESIQGDRYRQDLFSVRCRSRRFNGAGQCRVRNHPSSDAAVNEPPQIIYYNAADVPVAQLNVYSDTLSGQQLYDYGFNFIRLQLFTIPGFSSPEPLGGVERTVMVNLNSAACTATDYRLRTSVTRSR